MNRIQNILTTSLIILVLLLATAVSIAADTESALEKAQAPANEQRVNVTSSLNQIAHLAEIPKEDGNPKNTTIAVMGIIGVFFAPMLLALSIAGLFFWYRNKRQQLQHQTISQMIDKGMEIPSHISFAEPEPMPTSAMRRGFLLTALGIGLASFFFIVDAPEAAGLGAIPFFVGLAYLLIWHLEKRQTQSID